MSDDIDGFRYYDIWRLNPSKLNEVYLQAQTELEAQSTTIRKPMVSAFQNIQNYYQTPFHEKVIFDRRSTVEVDVIVVPEASDISKISLYIYIYIRWFFFRSMIFDIWIKLAPNIEISPSLHQYYSIHTIVFYSLFHIYLIYNIHFSACTIIVMSLRHYYFFFKSSYSSGALLCLFFPYRKDDYFTKWTKCMLGLT